ncbi:MAG: DegV family protein [Thermotogota bacterium]|nr:DegV family protein [Thermotogota bacterium]
MIAFAIDNAITLPEKTENKYGIKIFKLGIPIYIDDRKYIDGKDITAEEFIKMYDPNSDLKTAVPSPGFIEDFLRSIQKEGYDEVIYFGTSTGLSGLTNSVEMVARTIDDMKIHVIDTKNVSVGAGYVVLKALEFFKESRSIKDIVEVSKENYKNIKLLVSVMDLTRLINGGRLPRYRGIVASLLRIKPLLHISNNGELQLLQKTRTSSKLISKMVNITMKHIEHRKTNLKIAIGLGHERMKDYALELQERLKSEVSKIADMVPEFITFSLPSVLMCHTGLDVFGCVSYGEVG